MRKKDRAAGKLVGEGGCARIDGLPGTMVNFGSYRLIPEFQRNPPGRPVRFRIAYFPRSCWFSSSPPPPFLPTILTQRGNYSSLCYALRATWSISWFSRMEINLCSFFASFFVRRAQYARRFSKELASKDLIPSTDGDSAFTRINVNSSPEFLLTFARIDQEKHSRSTTFHGETRADDNGEGEDNTGCALNKISNEELLRITRPGRERNHGDFP